MTTARQRYEAKTKVVTFRVHRELYDELERIRARIGLSYADLVKLGAGLAGDQLKSKIDQAAGLQSKLDALRKELQTAQEDVKQVLARQTREHQAKLEQEAQAYRLFDAGWPVAEVCLKLSIGDKPCYDLFKQWGELRRERQLVQWELLRRCLQHHINYLLEQIHYRLWGSRKAEAEKQVEYFQRLLADPSQLAEEQKASLVAQYSWLV